MERLTESDLARMRMEHVPGARGLSGYCGKCCAWDTGVVDYPCDVARLLAHFAPGPVAHLVGIAAGLFGPTTSEELQR
jgi:hypothetical protein